MTASTERDRRVIWVVDDSQLELELAQRALAQRFAVGTFSDGSAMLEAISTGRTPDVLVLDWQMPGMSGIEVAQFLRGNPATVELPIVLLTSFRQTDDIVRGLTAGANDYVVKPYAAEELLARVEALVRVREMRERAERAEATVNELLEQLPEALVATDADGIIQFVNFSAEVSLQEVRSRLVGKPVTGVLPGFAFAQHEHTTGEAPIATDVKLGNEIFAPAVRRMSISNHGPSFVITLRNVTEKRRAEDRRLDFYSIIAHDLRSPLTAIAMRNELILRGARGPITPATTAELGKVGARVNELVALINDFLDLARLEGTGLKIEREAFDINGLVSDVVEELRPTAESGGLTMHTVPEPCASITGDRRRLTQVLTNLVANAIKFTPRGGQVDIGVECQVDGVVVRVHDNGRGIPADALPSLFQRYARAQPTAELAGTGLGLLIVREIVEAHGGSVGVQSEIGHGSTFWFRLPRPRGNESGT